LDPKSWQNPEQFIPERFEEGGEHDSHTGLTWVPFSNGSRQCLGINFSLTEQRVVLSMMCKLKLLIF
jgi:cytochrome P450